MAVITGLFAFDKNPAHIYIFEAPDKFSEYYINSTGKRCVSIGKYEHCGNGCFLIQYDSVKDHEGNSKGRERREIYISYVINRQGFFVSFKTPGETIEERRMLFVNFASTHYNWGPRVSKQSLSLEEYEKMIIQKHLYKF